MCPFVQDQPKPALTSLNKFRNGGGAHGNIKPNAIVLCTNFPWRLPPCKNYIDWLIHSRDNGDQRICHSYWRSAFWPITCEPGFSQICSFCRKLQP